MAPLYHEMDEISRVAYRLGMTDPIKVRIIAAAMRYLMSYSRCSQAKRDAERAMKKAKKKARKARKKGGGGPSGHDADDERTEANDVKNLLKGKVTQTATAKQIEATAAQWLSQSQQRREEGTALANGAAVDAPVEKKKPSKLAGLLWKAVEQHKEEKAAGTAATPVTAQAAAGMRNTALGAGMGMMGADAVFAVVRAKRAFQRRTRKKRISEAPNPQAKVRRLALDCRVLTQPPRFVISTVPCTLITLKSGCEPVPTCTRCQSTSRCTRA